MYYIDTKLFILDSIHIFCSFLFLKPFWRLSVHKGSAQRTWPND